MIRAANEQNRSHSAIISHEVTNKLTGQTYESVLESLPAQARRKNKQIKLYDQPF